ncbi:MAG TPA: OsmC family protein [Pirellulales bacterium]|nr:OsmC family protein [Pirellulales bacterium]
MPVRSAQAVWEGDLKQGHGTMRLGSGAYEGAYSFLSRFENGTGTNPEELIAAAHAGCFSMALSNALSQAGFPPKRLETTAKVHLERGADGFSIPRIELSTQATVPGIDESRFRQEAEKAKQNCPVSKLLAAAQISLDAKLVH